MDRFPCYQSLLARVEHKKAQVKSQLPTEHAHLLDEFAVYVLDQVNMCLDGVSSSAQEVEDVSNGQSVHLCKSVKKEEEGGECLLECDCKDCETCKVKMEMKEELDESGFETELAGNQSHVVQGCTRAKKEEEDGVFELERPNKIQRMNRVVGNVPIGSASSSSPNVISVNVDGVDDQVTSHLTAHIRTHTGERPFKCETCNATFTQNSSLTTHLRMHTGERLFKCETCNATFTQNSSLATHLRMHTGERPFVCTWPECGQAFARSSILKTHSRVHSNERQFVCDVAGCTKVYKHKHALRKHQKAKHNMP